MPTGNIAYEVYRNKIGILMQRWPTLFVRENPLPLVDDIFEQIIAVPELGMGDDELEYTLACWKARREYCRSICHIQRKHNLRGEPVDRFSDEALAHQEMRYERFVRRGEL